MEFVNLVFENWWQAILIIIVLGCLIIAVSNSFEKLFNLFIKTVRVIGKEFSLRTQSVRASIINLFFGILAAFIAIIIITPSILCQLGFTEENINSSWPGIILVIIVFLGSGLFIYKFETELRAFKDD